MGLITRFAQVPSLSPLSVDKNGSSTAGSRILQGVAVHIENRRSTRASDGGVPKASQQVGHAPQEVKMWAEYYHQAVIEWVL